MDGDPIDPIDSADPDDRGDSGDTAAEEDTAARPVDRFRRTAVGGVVAAGLFGLRDALEGRPEREQTTIEVSAPTREEHGPVEVVLDFDRPGHGIVVIRRNPEPDDQPGPDA